MYVSGFSPSTSVLWLFHFEAIEAQHRNTGIKNYGNIIEIN